VTPSPISFMRISTRSGYRCAVVNDARGTLIAVRETVQSELSSYLTLQREYLSGIGSELIPVCDALESFLLEGGKRLRPLFAYAGFAATGKVATAADIRAFTSLELLQACALIHDDLMDRSDTRRGKPAIHRHFENLHQQEAMNGLADQFGEAAAVLLGDLALVWSDHLLHTSGVENSALLSALKVHDEMRIELMAGQYLDVREAGERSPSVDRSLRIARYKSGKYTIERPLHLGGALATDDSQILQSYTNYGLPLGEAFQLRDDVLGVFGDPSETGKPAGDDLREGKRTVLIEMTYQKANSGQKQILDDNFGKDLDLAGVEKVREVVTQTGALGEVENMISSLFDQSQKALAEANITAQAKEAFSELALAATSRRV